MLLEIYYEEKSWDSLEAILVSFSRYLQRKQVIAYHKKVYKNIISLTRKLMSLKPYDKVAKKVLLEELKYYGLKVHRLKLRLKVAHTTCLHASISFASLFSWKKKNTKSLVLKVRSFY